MFFESGEEISIFLILDPKVIACLLQDFGQDRVMHMAYLGKNMVDHMDVDTAHEPGTGFIMAGKISGGLQNMQCIVVVDITVLIGLRKGCTFVNVGNLENKGENQPGKQMHEYPGAQHYVPG